MIDAIATRVEIGLFPKARAADGRCSSEDFLRQFLSRITVAYTWEVEW